MYATPMLLRRAASCELVAGRFAASSARSSTRRKVETRAMLSVLVIRASRRFYLTRLLSPVGARGDLALRFLNGDGLPRRYLRELVHLSAGPVDFDGISFVSRSHAEGQHQFAL